ncbi:MAG: 5-formyltetrahydrofolate cyclo-ligase [Clostridia bacterium]|nr:5-formyltetrahydrofolate cyclo-ligase [Clostridia bacterium]
MEKALLREHYKALRASVTQRKEKSRIICEACAGLLPFLQADTVLLYWAKGSEADTAELCEQALRMGKTVAYPRCSQGGKMTFRTVTHPSELSLGSYGIKEPPESAPEWRGEGGASICIVPALAYDLQGFRLGYGGGYYDRFLESFLGVTVGITYEECLAERLPREGHDKKTDYIITESRVNRISED